MRIFKNRGDIYFSKTNKEKSMEQRILIISLVVIIIFTAVFLIALGIKYDFSAKKFFAPEKVSTTEEINETARLPQVEGKSNFLFMLHKDNNLLFTAMMQFDMDNTAYKVSTLKADTEIDGNKMNEIFSQSAPENVKKAVESYFSLEFDYYISMEYSDYISFFDSLGEVNYPVLDDIKFKASEAQVPYSVKINTGEQRLKGSDCVSLIRYYLEEKNNTFEPNNILLNSLSQLINSENMAKSDSLFRDFVTSCETDITVKDYSLASEKLLVLTDDRTGARVYNARLEYSKNKIKDESLREAKGYFVK